MACSLQWKDLVLIFIQRNDQLGVFRLGFTSDVYARHKFFIEFRRTFAMSVDAQGRRNRPRLEAFTLQIGA